MLVRVYTFQNATLLEISCTGSNTILAPQSSFRKSVRESSRIGSSATSESATKRFLCMYTCTCTVAYRSSLLKSALYTALAALHVLFDFSLTVKAAPHECVIRTSQP